MSTQLYRVDRVSLRKRRWFAPDFTNTGKTDIITVIYYKKKKMRPGLDRRR